VLSLSSSVHHPQSDIRKVSQQEVHTCLNTVHEINMTVEGSSNFVKVRCFIRLKQVVSAVLGAEYNTIVFLFHVFNMYLSNDSSSGRVKVF
jgi:hypothetical protein